MYTLVQLFSAALVFLFYGFMTWVFVALLGQIFGPEYGKALGIPTGLLISCLFFIRDWRGIPEDPPHKGIMTFFGKRSSIGLNEGYHYFPGYPFVCGLVLVHIQTKDQGLTGQKVHTPDQAECMLPGNISWTPDPEYLVNYLNSGGEKGIRTKTQNIWEGVVREWAISDSEGPQTYMELLGAQEEAVNLLLRSFARESLTPITTIYEKATKIPTSILFKYFKEPQKPPTETEAITWGEKWEKLKTALDAENPTPEAILYLRGKVTQRRNEVTKARDGRGHFEKPEWGIEINLLNIGQAEPLGELAKAMELEAKEKREKAGEITELDHVEERITKMAKNPAIGQDAKELVMVERKKATKDIKEIKLNVSPELIKLGTQLLDKLTKRGDKNG